MTERACDMTFESVLDTRIRAYAEGGVRPIDRYAIASAAIGPGRRGWLDWSALGRSRWMTPIYIGVVLLTLALAIGLVAVVGAAALRTSNVLPAQDAPVIDYYSGVHIGWIYVYADGRVIFQPDRVYMPGTILWGINERRLTEASVGLVRAGVVDARAILTGQLPESAWADGKSTVYRPSIYAVCFGFAPPNTRSLSPPNVATAAEVFPRIPEAARAALRGNEHVYQYPLPPADGQSAAAAGTVDIDCWDLTPAQADALFGILTAAGWKTEPTPMGPPFLPGYRVDDSLGSLHVGSDVILPHGDFEVHGG
jgi:hypothetical protein